LDPDTNEKYIPYCIEPSVGADRVALAFLVDAYDEEEIAPGDSRVVLRFHPALAPVKAAVFPLSKKLREPAYSMYQDLAKHFMCEYDESGSIGKRYRRQDEIGTPYCITIDFESLDDHQVTIRHRDSMNQVRLPMADVLKYLQDGLAY
jgi:glycyl-tRNA synthetase